MSRDEILDVIIAGIKESLNDDSININEESKLVEDLGMDSMDGINLIMDLEEHFRFGIQDEEFAKFTTVGSIADFISAELNKKS